MSYLSFLTRKKVQEQACPACGQVIPLSRLREAQNVCACGHHFRIGARQRIAFLTDKGSFKELFRKVSPADVISFPGYLEKLKTSRLSSGEKDGVICGTASIGGQPCCLFVMEPNFMMGSMGTAVGERVTRLFEYALKKKLPVVGFTVSGGARMQEGLFSLMQMAKTSGAVKRHGDAGLFFLTVLTDPTTGGVTASFAMEGDILLAEPGATIGFAGARVIQQTTRETLPQGFQTSEFLLEHGFLDAIVPRAEQKTLIAQLLRLHAAGRKAAVPAAALQGLRNVILSASARSRTQDGAAQADPAAKAGRSAYEIVRIARGSRRPTAADYIRNVFTDFMELHGDRRYADDAAVVAGIACLDGMPVTVIGLERGHDINERIRRSFGAPNPEGYRKALRLMKQAEKFRRPVVCIIDTSGARCGIGAEERGQGQAIAENLMEMMTLRTPVISLVIGEGGSGGALALGVADQVWMLEHAVYSVISPEGCASILWKDAEKADEAAELLRLTAQDALENGIIERIFPEDDIGSDSFYGEIRDQLDGTFRQLCAQDTDVLLEQRYQRFRRIGSGKKGNTNEQRYPARRRYRPGRGYASGQ